MISVGNLSILSNFWTRFWQKCSTAVSMATAIQIDERIVDYLVLGPNTHDRKVSAKSVTMRATALCKNLSGYRELLLTSAGALFQNCDFVVSYNTIINIGCIGEVRSN